MGHRLLCTGGHPHGKPYPDALDEMVYWDGAVSPPKIFPVGFKPRSEKHAEVIRRSYEDLQEEWRATGLPVDVR